MVGPPSDQYFLRSIFLMEAWDSIAALDDGFARLVAGDDPVWDEMLLVVHRLRGAAALQGFVGAASAAEGMEEALNAMRGAPADGRRSRIAAALTLLTSLKSTLEAIERGADVSATPATPPGDTVSPAPATQTEDAASPSPAAPTEDIVAPVVAERVAPETAAEATPATADPLRAQLLAFFVSNDEVLSYFAPEASEHLDAMTTAILALEREGANDSSIAALFRAVHTLKGAAYVIGCRPIGELAHELEDLLVAIREGRAPLAATALDVSLSAVDCFKQMLDPAAGPGVHLTSASAALRSRIRALLETVSDEASTPPDPVDSTAAPAVASPETMPNTLAAPAPPVSAPPALPRPRPAPRESAAPARGGRQTIRVALERLDGLMDLVGELVVARSGLERRLSDFEHLGELLFASRARLSQSVTDFERRQLPQPSPSRRDRGDGDETTRRQRSVSELFAELEFDRYDDFTLFARGVAEIASDLSEMHTELASLGRVVREDLALVHRLTAEVRAGLGRARLVPLGSLYTRFVRQGQEAARANGKSVRIETSGESVELDASVIEQVIDPLLHLVQNAVVHGLESPDERRAHGKAAAGTITLSATHRGAFVVIDVSDDGRGIDVDRLRRRAVAQKFITAEAGATMSDHDALELIFRPGFSTAAEVTTTAGRGVGMDVVRTNIGRLNGDVVVESELGAGTRFRLRLPLTVLVTEALMVRVGTEIFAIPLNAVHVITTLAPDDRRTGPDGEAALIEERWLPLIHLDRTLGLAPSDASERPPVLALRGAGGLFACVVDQALHKEEIVVKPLGSFLDGIGPYSGATVSADGRVTLLLDAPALGQLALRPSLGARTSEGDAATPRAQAVTPGAARSRGVGEGGLGGAKKGRVLLVDDSLSVRKFVGAMLDKAGFQVVTAIDGADALAKLVEAEFDVLVTDLEMPRMNGYELLEDVRRRRATRALPVVILTTRAGDKHQSLARNLGVNHYITKPVAEEAFVRLIESLTPGAVERTP